MTGIAKSAYRAHDNRALAARGAVRNPWVRTDDARRSASSGAVSGTPVKMKRTSPAAKPAPAAQPRVKPAKPAKPAAAKPKRSVGAASLNTRMRFTPETIHNDFKDARDRAELEAAWQRSMMNGPLPVADGLSHNMEVGQARVIMSAAKYLTDAMPWLRERLARVGPADASDIHAAIARGMVGDERRGAAAAYTTAEQRVLSNGRSAGLHSSDERPGGMDWIVLNRATYSRQRWAEIHAQNSMPFTQANTTFNHLISGITSDGTSFLAVSQTPAAILAHEVGHVIHRDIALPLSMGDFAARMYWPAHPSPAFKAMVEFRNTWRSFFTDQPGRPASLLSQYAKKSWGEAFAESVSVLIYGTPQQRSQPIVQEVARIINLAHPGTFKLPGERTPRATTARATTARATTARKAATPTTTTTAVAPKRPRAKKTTKASVTP